MEDLFADVYRPLYENIRERFRLDAVATDFTIDETDAEAQQDIPDGEEESDDD